MMANKGQSENMAALLPGPYPEPCRGRNRGKKRSNSSSGGSSSGGGNGGGGGMMELGGPGAAGLTYAEIGARVSSLK